jgi:hypothetical protein
MVQRDGDIHREDRESKLIGGSLGWVIDAYNESDQKNACVP